MSIVECLLLLFLSLSCLHPHPTLPRATSATDGAREKGGGREGEREH